MGQLGIYLDDNIVMDRCLGDNRKGMSIQFISLLEDHPKLGIIASRAEENIRVKLWHNRGAIRRFYELKENLKVEKIDKQKYNDTFKKVRKMFPYLSHEDSQRLAAAAHIKQDYETLYFATLDKHFLEHHMCERIQNNLNVRVGYPETILKEVSPTIMYAGS